ncbi:hypothetical protein D4764_02G0002650 [Takifugu flavidus]|uniref:Reverse transcriptase domain-containing protein n=1 Tax=Takifugu flavidus TaxID=433684 RepID=A0A5C6NI84_9TELE|nr:hypothetical protein D4764_02G0002650 [Takifugu flavidus]
MFEHKVVHLWSWHHNGLGRRSMIDFIVVSADLRPYVLDTRVKRGAQLSTDHSDHYLVSFDHVPRAVGDIESEWAMLRSTIVEAAVASCGCKATGAGPGSNPHTRWWTPEVRGTVKLKKEAYRSWLIGGSPEAADRYRGGRQQLAIIRRWKEYFQELLNPTNTYHQGGTESEDQEVDHPIFEAEVAETGVVVPIFKSGDQRVCSNYRGITLLSLPGKVYARVLEKRIRLIVEPLIEEEQCGFCPGRGTTDQLFTHAGVLERSWEFAQPVHMCFVDLEKAYDWVPRSILCGGAPGVWDEWSLDKNRPVPVPKEHELGPDSRLISRCSQGVEGVQFGGRMISSLLFADDAVVLVPSSRDLQQILGRFATECEAAGMRLSTSKLESMVLARKREEVLPQVEEFKYLRILFMSEGRMEREIDRRIGVASTAMRALNRSVVVKKELSRKAKLSIYRSIYVSILTYGHQRWVMTERTRSRIQAAEMSFLRRVAGLSLRDRVRSSDIREELGVELLLLHIERSELGWLGHLARMPSGRLSPRTR